MSLIKSFIGIFKNKKVIVLSDNNIETREITNFSRFVRLLCISWFIFSTVAFFLNTRIQADKNKKIDALKNINTNLKYKIEDLSYVINNMKDYLTTLNFYDRFNQINIKDIDNTNSTLIASEYVSEEEYKNIMPILDNLERNISNVEILVNSRVNGLNDVLRELSLEDNAKEIYNVNYKNLDLATNENTILKNSVLVKKGDFINLKNNIKYMNFLESFLNSIPIAKPMKNYYISSKFGSRVDPFTKKVKLHKGLDFAGPYNSPIYAPADGTVNVVAKRGGFGNSVEIDHGNNIKTEYAHLTKSLVKVGDTVKRGDKIAIQGNTGRSTGQHLHWEVRVKNKNVDPMKFVKVGEKLF